MKNDGPENIKTGPFQTCLITNKSLAIVLAIVVFTTAFDLGTKALVLDFFATSESRLVPALPTIDFTLHFNPGVSFGLFSQNSPFAPYILAGFNLVVAAVLFNWLLRPMSGVSRLAISLIIGGALGNGIDRMVRGAVVDFIYFHVGNFNWYVFNLADCWISIGATLLIVDTIVQGRISKERSNTTSS